jgi:hypothetical protein
MGSHIASHKETVLVPAEAATERYYLIFQMLDNMLNSPEKAEIA